MIVIDAPQRSPEWFAARVLLPTASCFGKIITPSRGTLSTSRHGYMAELIADYLEPPEDDGFSSGAMADGVERETTARQVYAFTHDVEVVESGLCLLDDRSAGASPDGLTENGGVEIKCPILKTHLTTHARGTTPNEYLPQIHGGMLVCERDEWDFMSYYPGSEPYYERHYRSDYTDKLEKALKKFTAEFAELKERLGIQETA